MSQQTTFYKITNEKECHHGFQYHDGLNVLDKLFEPTGTCVEGGLYFSDEDNIHKFLDYGCWLRVITIPEDAQMVKDPEGDKWRADKIILGNKYEILNIETLKKSPFLCKGTNLARYAAKYGHLDCLKYIH